MEKSQGIRSRTLNSMQNKNSKNLCLDIGDSASKNNLIIADSRLQHASRSIGVESKPGLIKRTTDAQIYTLPSTKKYPNSTPATPHLVTSGRSYNVTPSPTSSTSSSPFNKPFLPNINTKLINRPRATTIATSIPQMHTPNNEVSMESVTRYWVFQENTPLSSNNLYSEIKNGCSMSMEDDMDTASETCKENCYPSGPLLVIPPFIYLYSEPSLNEVLDYDLIINVAKEITSYKQQLPPSKQDSYFHFTWSHTSLIMKNLPQLTELIHDAFVNQKKVLIHCQCGVSRSASLIVAYIMRYDKLNLNDAYNKLKGIAREICPNMSLLFQLMEWEEWLKNCDSSDNNCRKQPFESISEFGELSL